MRTINAINDLIMCLKYQKYDMAIIAKKHDPKNTNYDQLKGSGLLPRGPICALAKCKPKSLKTPKAPAPQYIKRPPPEPLIATKASPSSNKWTLNSIQYPTFNSLWVNIPRGSFTVLRTNG
jgi:hypothetical protein